MKSVLIIDSNNNVIQQYNIEDGEIQSINLLGNWSKDGNSFTFQDGYFGTDVFYIDGYGKDQQITINDDLYLNGNLTLGYTGTQYLTFIDEKCGTFDGYKTFFDVTGTTQPANTEENMFNNFADNSLKVLLSNIPGYIQYAFIFMFLLFFLGMLKLFKKRK